MLFKMKSVLVSLPSASDGEGVGMGAPARPFSAFSFETLRLSRAFSVVHAPASRSRGRGPLS